jgi:Ferritin-like domain
MRSKGRPRVDNPSRRRVLVAGLTGTALSLVGGRAASAGTTPPSEEPQPTEPPAQPTAEDLELLGFAQSFELTARDLYAAALEGGADDPMIGLMRDQHQAYADILSGVLGTKAPGTRDDGLYDELERSFAVADVVAVAEAGFDLESTAVATHTELLGQLQGIDGAKAGASILVVEARSGTVLADLAGNGTDLDALFVNDAEPLAVSRPTGG